MRVKHNNLTRTSFLSSCLSYHVQRDGGGAAAHAGGSVSTAPLSAHLKLLSCISIFLFSVAVLLPTHNRVRYGFCLWSSNAKTNLRQLLRGICLTKKRTIAKLLNLSYLVVAWQRPLSKKACIEGLTSFIQVCANVSCKWYIFQGQTHQSSHKKMATPVTLYLHILYSDLSDKDLEV